MKRLVTGVVLPLLLACGVSPTVPSQGRLASHPLPAAFSTALREEAIGNPAKARAEYVALLADAATADGNPWQLSAVTAALDALVMRTVGSLAAVSTETALAFRSTGDIAPDLEKVLASAKNPFVRGAVARALAELAEARGDAGGAAKARAEAGCLGEATVLGPVAWTVVTGVHEPDVLDRFDAPVPESVAAPGAFGAKLAPVFVQGLGCTLPIEGASAGVGLRDVVVDLEVPSSQKIALALRAHTAASVRVGGRVVIERPFELGSGEAVRRAWVDVPAGRVRVVVRVAFMEESARIEIDAWDEAGRPLVARAPKPGQAANGAAIGSSTLPSAPVAHPGERSELPLLAAGMLADGYGNGAEGLLANTAAAADATPELLLVYGRAVERARDLTTVRRAERARSAYERVLEAWPGAWEAIVQHADLAGVRRASSEARLESLRDLDERRAKAGPSPSPIIDAYDAATSGRERLLDRAAIALGRARVGLAGTTLLHDTEAVAVDRVGPERKAYACDSGGPRNTTGCLEALRAMGDLRGAAQELDRVRALVGAPTLFLNVTLHDALALGDAVAARRAFEAMSPGERTLSFFAAVTDKSASGDSTQKALRALAITAGDAPAQIGPLARSFGDDPLAAFAGRAEAVVAADAKAQLLPGAPTAILAHAERYDVADTGLLHGVIFDVRRVTGTTDVEQNAQAEGPTVYGKATTRILRRRILKRDGRIIEPDRTPHASQAHAELAQLESGDAVEAIYEYWALPGETGDLSIDTPDLLPDRTAVHEASIDVVVPESLKLSIWSHPLLGKGEARAGEAGRKTFHWELHDHAVRRIEDGIPRMDRPVAVCLGTSRWTELARALRETLAALDEHGQEVATWAREAGAGKAPGSRALVEAVVEAAGRAVREPNPGTLSDFGVGRPAGAQTFTARTILSDHQGSRSWLVLRALRELGVPAEVAISEELPFSSDPAFPPHFGRFVHPLVLAHAGGEDIWIDADVLGPPLPAGRISPELRGRSMLRADGRIEPVPKLQSSDERNEANLRLTVDAKGDARGTFAILLRGREAQDLAESLFRVVGAERQRALRNVVLAWVPYANVDHVGLSSTEGSWQVAIRADVTVSGYAQVEASAMGRSSWVLPGLDPLHFGEGRARTARLGATYASQGARENALAVSTAVQYRLRRHVTLPSGAEVTRTPSPFEVRSAHLEAARKLAVTSGAIEDEFVLSVPTGTVAASEYGAFVGDAHHTDDAFLAGTWVKPPP